MIYRVSWTIEIEADSTVEAAFKAHKAMGTPEKLPTQRLSMVDPGGQLEVFEFDSDNVRLEKPGHA
jgi:hypothetical protein